MLNFAGSTTYSLANPLEEYLMRLTTSLFCCNSYVIVGAKRVPSSTYKTSCGVAESGLGHSWSMFPAIHQPISMWIIRKVALDTSRHVGTNK